MSHPCTHQKPAKASGGRCRFVELLIVLLLFLLQLLSVANCFSRLRSSVDSSGERAAALCMSSNHNNPNKSAFTQHSFSQGMNSLQCLSCPWSLSSASKRLCVCMSIYMCLPFTVILVKIFNYSYRIASMLDFLKIRVALIFFLPAFACIFILVCVNYQYDSKLHYPIMQYCIIGNTPYKV